MSSSGAGERFAFAEASVDLATRVGWTSSVAAHDAFGFDVRTGKHVIRFRRSDYQWPKPPPSENADGAIRLRHPVEIALEAFETALGPTYGHATVLSPVGRYGSPLATGAIDSVVLEASLSGRWTLASASISHTRCWLTNVVAHCPGIGDGGALKRRIEHADRLTAPPGWMAIRDTASLSEYARDCGWDDALFPDIVVLSADLLDSPAGRVVSAWLAFTEGAVTFSVAEDIASHAAGNLDQAERFGRLRAAAYETLGARL